MRAIETEARRRPPGPTGFPIIGSTVDVMRDPLCFYEELAEYGDIVEYRTLHGNFTALLHPDHVERVLLQESDRFEQVDISTFGVGIDPEGLVEVRGTTGAGNATGCSQRL